MREAQVGSIGQAHLLGFIQIHLLLNGFNTKT